MTLLGAALAGCDKQPETVKVEWRGKPVFVQNKTQPDAKFAPQVAADAAAAAYSSCVDKAAAAVDLAADQPAALTDRAMKACIAERATAVAKVQAAEMARGGDPVITAEVAERSLRVADDELRARATAAIVTRKYSDKKAS